MVLSQLEQNYKEYLTFTIGKDLKKTITILVKSEKQKAPPSFSKQPYHRSVKFLTDPITFQLLNLWI